ncbi:hypothetical protein Plhal304r1_c029g0095241 [Plasmopara halstedii]
MPEVRSRQLSSVRCCSSLSNLPSREQVEIEIDVHCSSYDLAKIAPSYFLGSRSNYIV